MIHGLHSHPAIVTASVARERKHYARSADTAYHKRRAHRRVRRAWRVWAADVDGRREPRVKGLTSWDLW